MFPHLNSLTGFGAGGEIDYVLIAPGAGTPIGGLTSGGGLAAAFDDNIDQAAAACARSVGDPPAGYNDANTVGKQWASPRIVSMARWVGPNDSGINTGSGTSAYRLEGSNDGSAWTTLVEGTIDAQTAGVTGELVSPSPEAYLFHRFNFNSQFTNALYCAEAQFFELQEL